MSEKRCDLSDAVCGCIREINREECLLCIISQQASMLHVASKLMVANAILQGGEAGFEVIVTSDRILHRTGEWIKKYRQDLEKEARETGKEERGLEMRALGPMTREELMAALIASGESKVKPI